MIQNDSLDNYLFIRHNLYRISESIPNVPHSKQLREWTKAALDSDFGKDAWKKVKSIKDPKELSTELKDLYIQQLEMKLFRWDKF
ncbi:MAG: hypothetical protein J0G96_05175 [Flavobacteriia bacterium]|nr:hypothetical protein [Flavobacteriia bacterium]OJX35115.1 MAG: hypothetical protein BGO87_08115 [Flavobacteriia bacterium 40-80]